MEPTPALRLELRVNLDAVIPPGCVDTDTPFTDMGIDALLQVSGSIEEASCRGWRQRANRVAAPGALVDISIGAERLKFQDPAALRTLALEEAEHWCSQVPGLVDGTAGVSLVFSAGPAYLPGITTDWDYNPLPSQPWPGDLNRLIPE